MVKHPPQLPPLKHTRDTLFQTKISSHLRLVKTK